MKALSFFPGSNTCRGFHGYFAELLPANDMRRVYILKGGPGVGKSTLMRRVGAAWEKQGRQVEYYWCSGDPGSLDAVVADGCMLMDGTSPHVVDPVLPGAADGIVNLGECLDETVMAAHRQEVIPLHRAMARCYSRAYHYLTGAEAALRDMQEIYAQAVDQGALINLRMELMQRVTGCAGRCQHLYAQAITGEGVRGILRALCAKTRCVWICPLDLTRIVSCARCKCTLPPRAWDIARSCIRWTANGNRIWPPTAGR